MKAGLLRKIADDYSFKLSSMLSMDMTRLTTGVSFGMGYRSDSELLKMALLEHVIQANNDKKENESITLPAHISAIQFNQFVDKVKAYIL